MRSIILVHVWNINKMFIWGSLYTKFGFKVNCFSFKFKTILQQIKIWGEKKQLKLLYRYGCIFKQSHTILYTGKKIPKYWKFWNRNVAQALLRFVLLQRSRVNNIFVNHRFSCKPRPIKYMHFTLTANTIYLKFAWLDLHWMSQEYILGLPSAACTPYLSAQWTFCTRQLKKETIKVQLVRFVIYASFL